MNTDLFSALENCLKKIRLGEAIEQAVSAYPELEAELRPLLEAAVTAQSLRMSTPVPQAAQTNSRERFLRTSQTASGRKAPGLFRRGFPGMHGLRITYALGILLGVLAFGLLSTSIVSARSLPGDQLYPFKLTVEKIRLQLTWDPSAKLALEQQYDQERLQEVEVLLEGHHSAEVTIWGVLEQHPDRQWKLADILLKLPPSLPNISDLYPGNYVEIHGVLMPDGTILVEQIQDRTFSFSGTIQTLRPNVWLVEKTWVYLSERTQVTGIPGAGREADLTVIRRADGSLEALSIQVQTGTSSSTPAPALVVPSVSPTREPDDESSEDSATPEPGSDDDHDIGDPSQLIDESEVHNGTKEPVDDDEASTGQPEPSSTPDETDDRDEKEPAQTTSTEQSSDSEPHETSQPGDD